MRDLSEYLCPEQDNLDGPGVLTSDQIEYYARQYYMIDPFDPEGLKPVGYELRVGEEYALGGERRKLAPEPGKDELRIPPFQVAIISTQEVINLPRFIIGRWNLRVKKVYEGLLWSGALQVDAGWVGRLFCPIYNLSNKDVILRLGERVVLMDFVKTTPFKKGESIEYHRPPRRQKLEDYNWSLESALFTDAARRINVAEKKVNRVEGMIGIMFTAIAILVAALTILITSTQQLATPLPWWLYLSVGLSVAAIATALYKRIQFEMKGWWLKLILIFYMIGSAIVIGMLWSKIP